MFRLVAQNVNNSLIFNTRQILQQTNICIPSGQTVAFVGYSGCGSKRLYIKSLDSLNISYATIESTALSLITRLYDPDVGQVKMRYRCHSNMLHTHSVLFIRS
jgi:ABC-type phosphate transport system ATPase subunit